MLTIEKADTKIEIDTDTLSLMEEIKEAAKAAGSAAKDGADPAAEIAGMASDLHGLEGTGDTFGLEIGGRGVDAIEGLDGLAFEGKDVAAEIEGRHEQQMGGFSAVGVKLPTPSGKTSGPSSTAGAMGKGVDGAGGTAGGAGRAAEGGIEIGVGMTLVETGIAVTAAGGTIMAVGAGATSTIVAAPAGIPTVVSGAVITATGLTLGAIGGTLVVDGVDKLSGDEDAAQADDPLSAADPLDGTDPQDGEQGESIGGQSNEDGTVTGGESRESGEKKEEGQEESQEDGEEEKEENSDGNEEDDSGQDEDEKEEEPEESSTETGTEESGGTGGDGMMVDGTGCEDRDSERGLGNKEKIGRELDLRYGEDGDGTVALYDQDRIDFVFDESTASDRLDPLILVDPDDEALVHVDMDDAEDRLDPVTLPVGPDGGSYDDAPIF